MGKIKLLVGHNIHKNVATDGGPIWAITRVKLKIQPVTTSFKMDQPSEALYRL